MLSEAQRRFLAGRRVAHLATADAAGMPSVVPVCFAVASALRGDRPGETLYITIDEKPKGDPLRLRRLRNLAGNPAAAVVADRYDEDWTRLGWVLVRGPAEILTAGDEHDRAQALLKERYPQLAAMAIAALPVIALRIAGAASWGDLSPD